MNCNEAGALVAAHADDELGGFRRHSIEQHLRSCTGCATKHRGVLALRARLRAEVPYFRAPPALHTRVRAMLADTRAVAPGRPRLEPNRWRWLTGGALAGCTATVLAWVLGTAVIDWRANEDVAVVSAQHYTWPHRAVGSDGHRTDDHGVRVNVGIAMNRWNLIAKGIDGHGPQP